MYAMVNMKHFKVTADDFRFNHGFVRVTATSRADSKIFMQLQENSKRFSVAFGFAFIVNNEASSRLL